MWQGDSVIVAETIELWREQQRIEARGGVVAVFPQAAAANGNAQSAAPILWKVRAPLMTYLSNTGRAHLEEGVRGSPNESLQSRTLDLFLTPAEPANAPSATAPSGKPPMNPAPRSVPARKAANSTTPSPSETSKSAKKTASAPPSAPITRPPTKNSSFPAASPLLLMGQMTPLRAAV